MSSIYDWSQTAASNASSDSDITWAEGQAPSTVNNSARFMMARIAELLADMGGAEDATGTANGILVTANSAFTTYANGRVVAFVATSTNTGAVTLNVNGIGAKAIRKMGSSGDAALAAGDIQADGIYVTRYNTTLNGGAGGWQLINPPTVSTGTSGHVVGFLDGNNTHSGANTFSGNVDMTAGNGVAYGSGSAEFYAGRGGSGMWAVGSSRALFSFSDRWWEITSSEALSRVRFKVGSSGTPWIDVTDGNTTVNGNLLTSGVSMSLSGFLNVRGDGTKINIGPASGSSATGDTVSIRPSGTGTAAVETKWNANGNMTVAGSVTASSFVGNATSATSATSATTATNCSRSVVAGTGMNGGGQLSANVTLNVDGTIWRDGAPPSAATIRSLVSGWDNGSIDSIGAGAIPGTARLKILSDSSGTSCMAFSHPGAGGSTIDFRDDVQDICGSIGVSAAGNSTSYNTSSDERLKDFIGTYGSAEAIAVIKADPVRKFTWRKSGQEAIGWGAQTSYAIASDLASPGRGKPGDEDFQPWGMDKGARTPYLWAAMGGMIDKIEELESRVSRLECRVRASHPPTSKG